MEMPGSMGHDGIVAVEPKRARWKTFRL